MAKAFLLALFSYRAEWMRLLPPTRGLHRHSAGDQ